MSRPLYPRWTIRACFWAELFWGSYL